MKTLACRDMGAMDCDFVATGESVEEVKQKMMEHASVAHPDVMANMTPEEMDQKSQMMEALMRDAE